MRKLYSLLALFAVCFLPAQALAQASPVCNVFTNFASFTHPTPDVWLGQNSQTGTTYTVLAGDMCSMTTFSNAASIAVTLPQGLNTTATSSYTTAGVVSFFRGWWAFYHNLGAGTVTITPTTSTINGAASLTLTTGQGAIIANLNGNYIALRTGASSTAGTVTSVTCNGGVTVITASGTCASRETLTANRTYYFRTDGNNACNGQTNAAGSSGNCAVLTIQKCIDLMAALDAVTYDVTCQYGQTGSANSFNAPVALKTMLGSGTFSLLGDVTTPSNLSITATGISGANIVGNWVVKGLKIISSSVAFDMDGPTVTVGLGKIEFAAATTAHIRGQNGAKISCIDNYTISGGTLYHWIASLSTISCGGITITLTGTPAWSGAFAYAEAGGYIRSITTTFSGAATGVRYSINENGLAITNSGSGTYYPGNAAGSVSTQGQYL